MKRAGLAARGEITGLSELSLVRDGELRDKGLITDAEFEMQKQKRLREV